MKLENKEKLSSLLNAHKTKLEKSAGLRKANEEKRENFLQSFGRFAKETAEPIMQKFAKEIESHGHYVYVNSTQAEKNTIQGGKAATVSMTIYMDCDSMKSGGYPYITFYANEHKEKVSVSVSTIRPGSGGSTSKVAEDIELSQLTVDFTEQQIMQGVANIFNNKY